ncbi:MAG: glycine--tRNA ligase subunit beta, partial [Novosphingobium meiothermophilum]
AINEKPTGSKDPFALRRAALGVVRLLLENNIRISLLAAMYEMEARYLTVTKTKLDEYPLAVKSLANVYVPKRRGAANLISLLEYIGALETDARYRSYWSQCSDLLSFFADRLKQVLRDQGKRHDLIDAVFALGEDDLVLIVKRVEALAAFLATEDGATLLAGYRRDANILKAEEKKGALPEGLRVDPALITKGPAAEQALWASLNATIAALEAPLKAEDFAGAMTALAGLRAPVDAFFEGVMVNDSDAKV